VDLGVVALLPKGLAGGLDAGGRRVRILQLSLEEGFREGLQAGVVGVHEDEPLVLEQRPE
jgi:hypothetical protein